MKQELTAEQELIQYAKEIKDDKLPLIVSDTIAKIRKTFADVVDINKSYSEQLQVLLKACESNGIEFVNAEIFGDMDDIGILRISQNFHDKVLLVDVFVSILLHDENKEDTEENTFLVCSYYSDVILEDNTLTEETVIQDINSNKLANILKGDNVRLQINRSTVDIAGKTFVYDGCHKLYIITTPDDREQAKEYGYIVENSTNENEIEHSISELEDYYCKSCPLRFVQYFDMGRKDYNILPQGTDCPMFIYY